MFRKFIKEKSGGVVEYIFILSFIGVLLLVLNPGMRGHIYDVYLKVTNQVDNGSGATQTYFNQDGKPVISTVQNKTIKLVLKPYTSSTTINSGTKFQFSAEASGGSGSFEYTWQNYNGDSTGKLGPAQTYVPGTYNIAVTARDRSTGQTKQASYSFTVNQDPQVTGLAVYDMGGYMVTTPYTKRTYRIGITVTDGNPNDYTCFWDSDITLSGYNDTKTASCASGAPFLLTAPQNIPINVTVCLVSDPTNCKNIAQSFEIIYPPVLLTGAVTASPAKSWYSTSDGIIFSASGSGGSENLQVEWQNYNGDSDQNGTGNTAQTYPGGYQTVQARVCDKMPPLGRCSGWSSFSFNVGNPISFVAKSSSTNVMVNSTVTFSVSNVQGGSGSYIYTWSITDVGTVSYTYNTSVSKVFTTAGTKTGTLKICDANNSSNCTISTVTVTVNPPVPINFGLTSNTSITANINTNITFSATGVTGGTGSFKYTWSVTDLGNFTSTSITKAFSATGAKTISLTICDVAYPTNCSTRTLSINIVNSPSAIYTYNGYYSTFTAPYTGTYTLETWGAQGGYGYNTWNAQILTNGGGKGAYAKGDIFLNVGETLFIYVGGTPGMSYQGGYNGGGSSTVAYLWDNSSFGGGGGGASDIRRGGMALENRIVVAGGGGGTAHNSNGIAAIGLNTYQYGVYGTGGTYGANVQFDNFGKGTQQDPAYPYLGWDGTAGTFGFGGNGGSSAYVLYYNQIWGIQGSGGGGGYYGGGGGAGGSISLSEGRFYYGGNGGGGSSYVDASMSNRSGTAGNSSQPNIYGSTQTGQTGNGAARITLK